MVIKKRKIGGWKKLDVIGKNRFGFKSKKRLLIIEEEKEGVWRVVLSQGSFEPEGIYNVQRFTSRSGAFKYAYSWMKEHPM